MEEAVGLDAILELVGGVLGAVSPAAKEPNTERAIVLILLLAGIGVIGS